MNLAGLGIYLAAAVMIDNQTLEVGKLVAFMEYCSMPCSLSCSSAWCL